MAPDHMNPSLKPVDVICQFDRKGIITPMKIRITDEDGEYQRYWIEEFIELKHTGAATLSDGVFVSEQLVIFECYITVYDKRRMIRLYYEPHSMIWQITTNG